MSKRIRNKVNKRKVLVELQSNNEDMDPEHQSCANDIELQTTQLRRLRRHRVCFENQQENYSDADDPDDPENDQTYEEVTKHRRRRECARWDVLKKIPYKLKCEWENCSYSSFISAEFVTHVADHIPSLAVRQIDEDVAVYVCLWEDCEAEIISSDEAIRHVYYHGFHTKLKSIGDRMMSDESHPKCLFDPEDRNVIMDLSDPFECQWENCDVEMQSVQRYYDHVHAHAVNYLACSKHGNKSTVPCLWRGCRAQPRGLQKMMNHLYTHTKEKKVACPVCGGTFASKTKFYDHCSRQAPKQHNLYQCSHCARSYPTERLLRDHMRHHVNSYKCPFCDMTSPTPSSLSLHIRNRHLTDKPFKCDFCDYRTQTKNNLLKHMSVHYSTALYHCKMEDCDFSCRTSTTLKKHHKREHNEGEESIYCCHICDARKSKGAQLSKHLIRKHNFRLPSGHSRFRYKADAEGLYRLETVRYESLEVTQELIQEGQQESQVQQTVLYLSNGTSTELQNSTPLFIAYETLDTQGNVVSQLVGAQSLTVPLVHHVQHVHHLPPTPVVLVHTPMSVDDQ